MANVGDMEQRLGAARPHTAGYTMSQENMGIGRCKPLPLRLVYENRITADFAIAFLRDHILLLDMLVGKRAKLMERCRSRSDVRASREIKPPTEQNHQEPSTQRDAWVRVLR